MMRRAFHKAQSGYKELRYGLVANRNRRRGREARGGKKTHLRRERIHGIFPALECHGLVKGPGGHHQAVEPVADFGCAEAEDVDEHGPLQGTESRVAALLPEIERIL